MRNNNNPFHLTSLLTVQEHTVASRTIVDEPAGTITLFAFDAGQGLSEHTAPYDAFILILEGAGRVIVGNASHTLGVGESLIVHANTPHTVRAKTPMKILLVMIKGKKSEIRMRDRSTWRLCTSRQSRSFWILQAIS